MSLKPEEEEESPLFSSLRRNRDSFPPLLHSPFLVSGMVRRCPYVVAVTSISLLQPPYCPYSGAFDRTHNCSPWVLFCSARDAAAKGKIGQRGDGRTVPSTVEYGTSLSPPLVSSPIHASFRTAQSGTVDSTSMRSCFWGVGKAPRIGGQYNLCVVLASYTRCIGPIFAKKKIRFVIHSWEVKARGPPHYPTSPALVKGAPDCNSVNRGWDRKGVSLMGYRRRIRFDDGPYSSDINLLHSILFSSF